MQKGQRHVFINLGFGGKGASAEDKVKGEQLTSKRSDSYYKAIRKRIKFLKKKLVLKKIR
jgi:hypothetical protein